MTGLPPSASEDLDATRIEPLGEESPAEPPRVGTVLKDRFILEQLIGTGGMGAVFKARDLRRVEAKDRNPYIAVKVLRGDFRRHPDAGIALQREARKAQDLAHPNVITVYDFDHDAGHVFVTMELLEGEPLSEILRRVKGHGLGIKKALPIIEAMGHALVYAHHKDIVHSDFKPSNVFVTKKGVVKVLDFGIARVVKHPGQDQETTLFDPGRLGAHSPSYASCEIIERAAPDPRDDIYALACVAYELLTGRHPFDKLTAVQARDLRLKPKTVPGLSRRQWRGLLQGLAFQRTERTPTVEAFLAELQARKRQGIAAALVAIFTSVLLLSIGYLAYDYLARRPVEQRFEQLQSLLAAPQPGPAEITIAASLLSELTALAPRDSRLERARDDLALAHLKLAHEAIAKEDWDLAREHVHAGQELKPGSMVLHELGSLSAKIDEEQTRQQQIAALRQRFENALASMPPTVEGAGQVLAILEELARSAPGDPLATDGRRRVAEPLARAAAEFGKAGHWQEGLRLAKEALALLPDSTILATVKSKLEQGLQAEIAERQKAEGQKKRREEEKRRQAEEKRRIVEQKKRADTAQKRREEKQPEWLIIPPQGARKTD